MDGATCWQMLLRVTVPLLRPTLALLLVLSVLTQGQPDHSTLTMAVLLVLVTLNALQLRVLRRLD